MIIVQNGNIKITHSFANMRGRLAKVSLQQERIYQQHTLISLLDPYPCRSLKKLITYKQYVCDLPPALSIKTS